MTRHIDPVTASSDDLSLLQYRPDVWKEQYLVDSVNPNTELKVVGIQIDLLTKCRFFYYLVDAAMPLRLRRHTTRCEHVHISHMSAATVFNFYT